MRSYTACRFMISALLVGGLGCAGIATIDGPGGSSGEGGKSGSGRLRVSARARVISRLKSVDGRNNRFF